MAGVLFALGLLCSQAQALLIDIGTADYNGGTYKLIYDADSPYGSIVWLDYTQGFNSWGNLMLWAGSLNSMGTVNANLNPGVNIIWEGDWRLPKTVDGSWSWGYDGTTVAGYNIITSEFGHLYYTELGNLGYYDTNGNYHRMGSDFTKRVYSPIFCLTGIGLTQYVLILNTMHGISICLMEP
jgi:hypothetical protein